MTLATAINPNGYGHEDGKHDTADQRTAVIPLVNDPGMYIEYALDSILGILDANSGSVFLWDEYSKELVLKAARGPHRDRIQDARLKLREGVSGWVGEKGHSILVKDIHDDNRFAHVSRVGSYRTYSFISLSLIAGHKLIGVINITERHDHQPFSEDDLARARTFAGHIAITYETLRAVNRSRHENENLHDQVSELRQKIREQEPLVAVGKLASSLAHELNNPLDSIRRYVNLALDQVMEDSLSREYLLKAKSGIRRAVQVIRGLLQFSRECSRTQPRTSELHATIEYSLQAAMEDHQFDNIRIVKKLITEKVPVRDCGLNVVFANLFKNAHHAMPEGGELRLETSLQGNRAVVRVRDTGCGIPPEAMKRLFEPFFSTKKEKGTGIGLTICRDIVEKCGGELICESSSAEGTQFMMTIPVARMTQR